MVTLNISLKLPSVGMKRLRLGEAEPPAQSHTAQKGQCLRSKLRMPPPPGAEDLCWQRTAHCSGATIHRRFLFTLTCPNTVPECLMCPPLGLTGSLLVLRSLRIHMNSLSCGHGQLAPPYFAICSQAPSLPFNSPNSLSRQQTYLW